MIMSRSIRVTANGIISFFYMADNIICIYYIFIVNSSVDGHLAQILLPCVANVNSAAMNIGVHVTFQIRVFSRYMPRSGIARSYGNSIFSF